jgi:hypothetical protein
MKKYRLSALILVSILLLPFALYAAVVPISPAEIKLKKVAILPFCDLSHSDNFQGALKWGGNRRAVAELTQYLKAYNVNVVPQSQVMQVLLNEGIIKVMKDTDKFGSPEHDILHSPHWEQMTKVIFEKIASIQEKTTPLNKDTINRIGNALGANVIIRGTIYHYEIRKRGVKDAFEGIVPFLLYQGTKPVTGYATGPRYEDGIYVKEGARKFHDFSIKFPLVAKSSNILFVVYAQDVKTGEIFWSSHFEVSYPDPNFNKNLRAKFQSLVAKLFKPINFGWFQVKEVK